jgi:hypothetical protein
LDIIGIQVDKQLDAQPSNENLDDESNVAPTPSVSRFLSVSNQFQRPAKRRLKFTPEFELVQLKKAKYRSEIEKNRAIAETARLQAEVAKLQISQLKSQPKN